MSRVAHERASSAGCSAALFAFAALARLRLAGLAFAASAIVFWLLLQFNRAVRVMKNAAASPVGHVASAVMFNARLSRGMTMLQIVTMTKSLGRKVAEGSDRRLRAGPTTAARTSPATSSAAAGALAARAPAAAAATEAGRADDRAA